MPEKLFFELDSTKKDRITEESLKEFAEYGYENSSTNRIVKNCGISKGSLFKYFESKQDLYFYLIDTVAAEMAQELAGGAELPVNLTDRILTYSALEISWYIDNPIKGKFMIGIASERGDIYNSLIERYGSQRTDIYNALLEDADMSDLHHDRSDVLTVIKWVLEGFKRDFSNNNDAEKIEDEYISQLKKYMDILKNGL